jgi:uncharacterized surface protein with fasciclin (FAS1) repeats
MSKRLFLQAAGAIAAGAVLQACGGGGGGSDAAGTCTANPSAPPGGSQTLWERVQQDASLSLFARAVSAAGLVGRYSDTGASMTLFAADNSAMNLLGQRLGVGDGNGLFSALASSQWAAIVNFATLPQALSRSTLDRYACDGTRPDTLWSFEGSPQALIFVFDNGRYYVWDGIGRDSITYSRNDIGANNGVLHVLTDPVLPRGVLTVAQMLRASIDAFGSFADRMVATGVSTQLSGTGPFTVFAPGFVQVPATLDANGVRRYVVPGRIDGNNFFAQGSPRALNSLANTALTLRSGNPPTLSSASATAKVVDVDFWGSNGVIHTIDAVL